jgi:hypothetical protein
MSEKFEKGGEVLYLGRVPLYGTKQGDNNACTANKMA